MFRSVAGTACASLMAMSAAAGAAARGPADPAGVDTGVAELQAVSALSANNVWAVGDHTVGGTERPLVQHWGGTAWRTVKSPSPAGLFSGVAAVRAKSVWAVGRSTTADGVAHTLIEHWNGHRWLRVASPSPGGATRDSVLTAVSAVSATSVWAVGWYDPAGPVDARPLVVCWNGTRWHVVDTPSPPGTSRLLSGISMSTATSGWAVGSTDPGGSQVRSLILHWNGHAWKQSTTASPGRLANDVAAVDVSGPANAWAVGVYQNEPRDVFALVLHFTEHHWRRVTIPNLGNQVRLQGVSAAPNDVWVVGFTRNGANQALMAHWDGRAWTSYTGPKPVGVQLASVDSHTAAATWTVGARWSGTTAIAARERWNGHVWTR